MTETLFKEVRYGLSALLEYIQLGEIGLPDIQRPFVWKNTKVRDLFDSMYKGYPVGYLLFWQNAFADDSKTIGSSAKHKIPRLLIVDGQQRLTSLYAVVKGVAVLREDYGTEGIEIAFDPMAERFEVADAAIRQDKSYLPNISVIWNPDTDLFDLVDSYLASLQASREIGDTEKKHIRKSIQRLAALQGFPFTALELSAQVDEEQVADVFVGINSRERHLTKPTSS